MAATDQQINNVELLQETLEQMFAALNANSVKVETTAAIGKSLHKVSSSLNELMKDFSFDSIHVIEPAQHEQRNFPRISNRLLVLVVQGNTQFDCSTLDFSLTGVRLQLTDTLEDKLPLKLALFLPQNDVLEYARQKPLEVQGSISWHRTVEGKNQYGIAFKNISGHASQKIRDCFEHFNKTPEFTNTSK